MIGKIWIIVSVIIVAVVLGMFVLVNDKNSHLQLGEKIENLNKTSFSITEFKIPDATAAPLYPVYDKSRNVIWVGDTRTNSSRIWEFNINSKQFTEHKLNGINIINAVALDSNNTIWYIDSESKLLGHYNPNSDTNELVKIPTNGTLSGIAIDSGGNLWLTVTNVNEFLRYDIRTSNFTVFQTPTTHASPLGIDVNRSSGQIWVAEVIGKIANIDPSTSKITEYTPSEDYKLKIPVAVISDSSTGIVYVTEHGEVALFSFDPDTKTFKRFQINSVPEALPFGMAFDNHSNLWIAEHTANYLAVLDTKTGESRQIETPSKNPLTQWLTTDSGGHVWLAEPGEASLGVVNEED